MNFLYEISQQFKITSHVLRAPAINNPKGRVGSPEPHEENTDRRVDSSLNSEVSEDARETLFVGLGEGVATLKLDFTCCVLPKDKLRFAARQVAFCFKARCVLLQDSLRFASRHLAFCFKTLAFYFKARCVLLQSTLRFASRHAAFCFKTSCVLSQYSCDLSHGCTAFCLLLKTLSAFW
uniref:Uncharacterized protein n=1 Tax=Tanacetum cinerariifolium TaxID=118510 RepID=A0A699JYT6_TANCI|nr:hypothetical protein [Tanacetum cinerariifolium]